MEVKRVGVDVNITTFEALKLIPYGARTAIMRRLLEILAEMVLDDPSALSEILSNIENITIVRGDL